LRSNKVCEYNVPKPKIFELNAGPQFDSANEQSSFSYFVKEGAEIVSTFLPSSTQFWCVVGPRISHDYPSVKHGITAVGALQAPLHQISSNQVVKGRLPEHNPLSLMNLSRGLRLASIADPNAVPLEVTLTACIYFTASSIWTEKVGAPSMHTAAGLRLLAEYDRGEYEGIVANKDEIETVFRPLFQRFTVSACAFSDSFPGPSSDMPLNYLLDIDLEKTGDFKTATEAFEAVGTLLKCVFRLREGVTMDGILPRVATAIDRCDDALNNAYLNSSSKEVSATGYTFNRDYHHLRVHLATIRIMFGTIDSEDETKYDHYRNTFQFILVESRQLLDDELSAHSRTTSGRNLRTTHGFIPPMFLTATKCRDLSMRKRAIELLHAYGHAERGWTSCMAVSLASFVIDQEHDHAPDGQLLDSIRKRICLENVVFNSALGVTFVEYWDYSNEPSASTGSTYGGSPRTSYSIGTPSSTSYDLGWPVLRNATLPFRSCGAVQKDGETAEMARKVLHAFGHTGVVLYAPKIACHCV
jgi:hypothetical protein